MFDANCFLTLTYNDECLPRDGSLDKRHLQLFFKRARKRFGSFRYYACGEYGDRTFRPHYHAAIFGQDFAHDRRKHKVEGGFTYYVSPSLAATWSLGHVLIGELSFESAAYVARYCTKKAYGSKAHANYTVVDYDTGRIGERLPEFALMSRRPGIGATWFARWGGQVYPRDSVVVRGAVARPPRYYDKLQESVSPEMMERLKRTRVESVDEARKEDLGRRGPDIEAARQARARFFARCKV